MRVGLFSKKNVSGARLLFDRYLRYVAHQPTRDKLQVVRGERCTVFRPAGFIRLRPEAPPRLAVSAVHGKLHVVKGERCAVFYT